MPPLIVGAGPAGCAAAITLAQGGRRALMIDRDETVRNPLCGGFLSWETTRRLAGLGIDVEALGASRITQLALIANGSQAVIPLPAPASGLSRHALDTAMRTEAVRQGTQLAIDRITRVAGATAKGGREWEGDGLFLATGKHDVRGAARPRDAADPALGIRIRLPPSAARTAMVHERIELHLFGGGYAGIILQEGNHANVCLAIKKSLFTRAGGDPADLIAMLAAGHPLFAERLGDDWRGLPIDTIGAVPYGYIARHTQEGQFRLGDQAAVIPSLAGEGIDIALASAAQAASHWLRHGRGGAAQFQRAFAVQARTPITLARLTRAIAESERGARLALPFAGNARWIVRQFMQRTRIG